MVSGDRSQDEEALDDNLRLRRVTRLRHWPRGSDNEARQRGRSPGSRRDEADHPQVHGQTKEATSHTGPAEPPHLSHSAATTFQPNPAAHCRDQIPCSDESVWSKYQKRYQIDLDGMVTVVQPRGRSTALFVVRRILNRTSSDQLSLLQHLCQESTFVRFYEAYSSAHLCHFICEYMDMTLEHLMGAPVYPEEKHIAAIAGQVIRST